jgi:hypothetical protein
MRAAAPLCLLVVALAPPPAQGCDGGALCKPNGCSLTQTGTVGVDGQRAEVCPDSCHIHSVSRTDAGGYWCECSQCGDNHNACVEAYGSWICDGLGPISRLYTGSFGLFALMALAWCFMPCIMIAVAHCTCISSRRNQGREPKTNAWLICIGTIVFFGLFGAGISVGWSWLICSFVMVIPFTLDSCYDEPRALVQQVNLVNLQYGAPQPQMVVQPQVVMMQQPMMVQQPMMMQQQQQPMMMQQQPMAPAAFNPAMQQQQQQQGQVVQATYAEQPQMKG